MIAMPATEPRAAAPALPMIVAAPAATRGAARPPVTPVREKQPVVGKGGSGNLACWVLPLSASHHLPWRLLTILLTKHPLCAWGHLPLISALSTLAPSLVSSLTPQCTGPCAIKISAGAGLTDYCAASDSRQAYQKITLPFPPVFFLLPGRLCRSGGEEDGL